LMIEKVYLIIIFWPFLSFIIRL